jgi:hypothetical protein
MQAGGSSGKIFRCYLESFTTTADAAGTLSAEPSAEADKGEDVVTVTNGVDAVDVTLPISESSAFYRAAF